MIETKINFFIIQHTRVIRFPLCVFTTYTFKPVYIDRTLSDNATWGRRARTYTLHTHVYRYHMIHITAREYMPAAHTVRSPSPGPTGLGLTGWRRECKPRHERTGDTAEEGLWGGPPLSPFPHHRYSVYSWHRAIKAVGLERRDNGGGGGWLARLYII